jgi:thioredoxin 1
MTIDEYNGLVKESPITICKMSASWCVPCKVLGEKIHILENELTDVKFIEIDVEDEPEVATALRIRNVPVLLYYKDGELKDKTVGLVSEQTIKEKVESLKA